MWKNLASTQQQESRSCGLDVEYLLKNNVTIKS